MADQGEINRPQYGLKIRKEIPNMGSIPASFTDYEVLKGIMEVPLSEFTLSGVPNERVKALADQISKSKEISPLIVAIDEESKPYILEGSHRVDALKLLGEKTLPAKIVIDTPSTANKVVIERFKAFNRLASSPYLQAISSAMQAYEYARPQEADKPSALEQYYANEGVERGLPSPRIEQKTQPKLGLQEGLNY